jgi:hypothetical protein
MVFPGNSSDGHYVRFNLRVGALLFLSVISDARYKGQVSAPPRSLFQTDVLDGYPVKDVVAIVRGPVSG